MIPNILLSTAEKVLSITFRWIDQNLVSNVLNFVRGFEFAIIVMIAALFLLVSAYMILRQYKREPKSYSIVVYDVFGRETIIDGLRRMFSTYDAAESYARLYRETYGAQQYQFKVVRNFL
jgi:hypothetical protein